MFLLLQAGSTLFAQLEIWKAARHEAWRPQWEHQQPSPNPTPAAMPSADDMSDGKFYYIMLHIGFNSITIKNHNDFARLQKLPRYTGKNILSLNLVISLFLLMAKLVKKSNTKIGNKHMGTS